MEINVDVLRLARALAAHAAERQSLVAQNVANADTPGYKAVDLTSFSDSYEVASPGELQLRGSRPGHLHTMEQGGRHDVVLSAITGAESPNGNTVSIEDQMVRAVEVRQAHEMAMSVYSKTLDILRASVRRGS